MTTTPKEWRALSFATGDIVCWDVDAGGTDDADRYSVLEDLTEADARLIAAAAERICGDAP
jgi:hypothetical protein